MILLSTSKIVWAVLLQYKFLHDNHLSNEFIVEEVHYLNLPEVDAIKAL
jgi:hypothetical protein